MSSTHATTPARIGTGTGRVSRRIVVAATPAEVFALLADPREHAALDGSGTALQSHPDPDRAAIVALYDRLAAPTPSSAVLGNRAAAIALASGAAAGLAAADRVQAAPGDHRLLVLRAELQAELGRTDEATATMLAALALAGNAVERRHLQERLDTWG